MTQSLQATSEKRTKSACLNKSVARFGCQLRRRRLRKNSQRGGLLVSSSLRLLHRSHIAHILKRNIPLPTYRLRNARFPSSPSYSNSNTPGPRSPQSTDPRLNRQVGSLVALSREPLRPGARAHREQRGGAGEFAVRVRCAVSAIRACHIGLLAEGGRAVGCAADERVERGVEE